MQIRISVIVPAYNREQTIRRCINSIICQTVQPCEIIVVDDGSTDGTISVLESMDCKYLKIIKQNHRGAQAARNLGILNAKGEYITFLDSDDEWLPQMLEREREYLLREKRSCVIYTDCYVCDDNGKRIWNLPGHTGNMYHDLLIQGGPMFQSMLAKRSLFLKIGLLDEKVEAFQEWETAIQLARKVKFIHICEPLFIYHCHHEETISKDENKGIQGHAYIVKKYQSDILKRHGFSGLTLHYKLLAKKCIRCKKKAGIIFGIKAFYYDKLSVFDRFIKKQG